MRCHLYLRKGKVFIPTFGRVPGGPYRDIEPVTVVEVSDIDSLRQASAGKSASRPPVVLKHAGVRSWGAFARGATPWSIEEENGIFQIIGRQRTPGGWVEDPEQTIDFPPGTTLDQAIDRMIAILQQTARMATN